MSYIADSLPTDLFDLYKTANDEPEDFPDDVERCHTFMDGYLVDLSDAHDAMRNLSETLVQEIYQRRMDALAALVQTYKDQVSYLRGDYFPEEEETYGITAAKYGNI